MSSPSGSFQFDIGSAQRLGTEETFSFPSSYTPFQRVGEGKHTGIHIAVTNIDAYPRLATSYLVEKVDYLKVVQLCYDRKILSALYTLCNRICSGYDDNVNCSISLLLFKLISVALHNPNAECIHRRSMSFTPTQVDSFLEGMQRERLFAAYYSSLFFIYKYMTHY